MSSAEIKVLNSTMNVLVNVVILLIQSSVIPGFVLVNSGTGSHPSIGTAVKPGSLSAERITQKQTAVTTNKNWTQLSYVYGTPVQSSELSMSVCDHQSGVSVCLTLEQCLHELKAQRIGPYPICQLARNSEPRVCCPVMMKVQDTPSPQLVPPPNVQNPVSVMTIQNSPPKAPVVGTPEVGLLDDKKSNIKLTQDVVGSKVEMERCGWANMDGMVETREKPNAGVSTVPKPLKPTFTMVGGTDVKSPKTWPFMAAIFRILNSESMFLCGGSLISSNTVLSAAHCFMSRSNEETYLVRLGDLSIGNSNGSGITQPSSSGFGNNAVLESRTNNVIVHPEFRYPSFYNDIAILKIISVTEFVDIVPVCLPWKAPSFDAIKVATAVGWGSKEFGGDLSEVLQQVELPIVDNKKCNDVLQSLGTGKYSFPQGVVDALIICAGNVNERKDVCQGDSGGPLMIFDEASWKQIGIVSGGFECGIPGIPGFYTRVDHYLDWIQQNL